MQRKDCDRTLRSTAVWGVLIVLIGATHAQGGTLELWREAVVTSDDVRLGDLCRVTDFSAEQTESLSALIVAVAPVPGGSIVYTGAELRRTLAEQGVNLATLIVKGAATCAVTRPVRAEAEPMAAADHPRHEGAVSPDVAGRHCLRDIIEQFFETESPRPGAKVRLRFGRANAAALDLCEPRFNFRLERTSGRALGMVGLKVTVFEDGEAVREIPLLVDVSITASVLVAARPINIGAIVDATDVRVVEMAFERRELVGASTPEAVIGRRAKRFVSVGAQIRTQDFEAVPLVKRGQLVDVYSNVGGVSIVTAAQALVDGTFGDVVALRGDGQSRNRFSATVSGPGRVRIGGGPALAMRGER